MNKNEPKLFFYADTHFCHKNILQYCHRPFRDVKEMNEELIRKWNGKVSPNDIVYFLGDFALCGKEKKKELISKLNGHKYLIMGNHDEGSMQCYYNIGFEKVYDKPIIFNGLWILSHERMFVNESMPYANIFGHEHNNPELPASGPNFICVSCERTNYEPMQLEEIENILEENHAKGIVRYG